MPSGRYVVCFFWITAKLLLRAQREGKGTKKEKKILFGELLTWVHRERGAGIFVIYAMVLRGQFCNDGIWLPSQSMMIIIIIITLWNIYLLKRSSSFIFGGDENLTKNDYSHWYIILYYSVLPVTNKKKKKKHKPLILVVCLIRCLFRRWV